MSKLEEMKFEIFGEWINLSPFNKMIHSPYFKRLIDSINYGFSKGLYDFPKKRNEVFKFLKGSTPDDIKVVIIKDRNVIYKPLIKGMGESYPKISESENPSSKFINFNHLKDNGVFLLNTSHTLPIKNKEIHFQTWFNFNRTILECISNLNTGVVYLIWSPFGREYIKFLNPMSNYIYEKSYPAYWNNHNEWTFDHLEDISDLIFINSNERVKFTKMLGK